MASFSEHTIEANELAIHYYEAGDRQNPTFVFLHGVMDNGLCWTPVAHELAANYHVVMMDARGHGKTGGSLHAFTYETLADDVAAFIRVLGLNKPSIWGHSMGASTATMLATNYPDLVSTIILEDPPFFGTNQARTFDDATPEQTSEMFKDILALRVLTPAERLVKARIFNPLWAEAEIEPWVESKTLFDPMVLQAIGKVAQVPWREAIPQITCPILLLTGDPANHSIVTAETAAEVQQLWQQGELAHISGAGHCIRRDKYNETMEVVRSFIERH